MATVDSKELIDKLIANDGYYEDDPRVFMIVEYTNAYGNKTYGVTWENEPPMRAVRYLLETEYVRSPKLLWSSSPIYRVRPFTVTRD